MPVLRLAVWQVPGGASELLGRGAHSTATEQAQWHRSLVPAAVRMPGCNPDLEAELIYVPAILARSSAYARASSASSTANCAS
jgi:hypothetical protein